MHAIINFELVDIFRIMNQVVSLLVHFEIGVHFIQNIEMHEFKMNKFFCCYPHAKNKKKNCLLQYFSLFCVIIVSFTLENIISISGFISEMRII